MWHKLFLIFLTWWRINFGYTPDIKRTNMNLSLTFQTRDGRADRTLGPRRRWRRRRRRQTNCGRWWSTDIHTRRHRREHAIIVPCCIVLAGWKVLKSHIESLYISLERQCLFIVTVLMNNENKCRWNNWYKDGKILTIFSLSLIYCLNRFICLLKIIFSSVHVQLWTSLYTLNFSSPFADLRR